MILTWSVITALVKNGDFLTLIFLCIYWKSTVKNSFLFHPLYVFLYLCICLWASVVTCRWFWCRCLLLITLINHFGIRMVPTLLGGYPFNLTPVFVWHSPIGVYHLFFSIPVLKFFIQVTAQMTDFILAKIFSLAIVMPQLLILLMDQWETRQLNQPL